MPDESSYKKLIDTEPTPAAIARFARIKDELNIRDDDALWGVVHILEMYTRLTEEHEKNLKSAVWEAVKAYADAGGSINIISGDGRGDGKPKISIATMVLLFGVIVLFGVLMFVAGVSLNEFSPSWAIGDGTSILRYIFSIPAGWILFVFMVIPAGIVMVSRAKSMKLEQGREKKVESFLVCLTLLLFIVTGIFVAIKVLS